MPIGFDDDFGLDLGLSVCFVFDVMIYWGLVYWGLVYWGLV